MYRDNSEPLIEELLSDPIVRALMAGDGLHPDYVWECVEDVMQMLRGRDAEPMAADP